MSESGDDVALSLTVVGLTLRGVRLLGLFAAKKSWLIRSNTVCVMCAVTRPAAAICPGVIGRSRSPCLKLSDR